jgi:hypothetical protein
MARVLFPTPGEATRALLFYLGSRDAKRNRRSGGRREGFTFSPVWNA